MQAQAGKDGQSYPFFEFITRLLSFCLPSVLLPHTEAMRSLIDQRNRGSSRADLGYFLHEITKCNCIK